MTGIEGRPNTDLTRYYSSKGQWKRKLRREFQYIEVLLQRINLRQPVTMGEMFQRAHRLKEVAANGYSLMIAGSRLKVEERVHRDIVRTMRSAQLYSETLKGRCEYFNYPTRTYPLFECEVQLPDRMEEEPDHEGLAEATLDNILGT